MLLQFTAGNYKSFRAKATLSMQASTDDSLEITNVSKEQNSHIRVLRSAAIFGANAGGKSNFIESMNAFRAIVLNSSKESQLGQPIPTKPFRLQTEAEHEPTFFEALFLKNGVRYRYGFESTQREIASEWLFRQEESIRESCLFIREGEKINARSAFKEGKGLEQRTRSNALFLSVVAQFNGEISGEVVRLVDQLRTVSGMLPEQHIGYTAGLLGTEQFGNAIRELVRQADTGIEDLIKEDIDADQMSQMLPKELPSQLRDLILQNNSSGTILKTTHRRFTSDGQPSGMVEFDLRSEESAGTRQFIALAGPFLHTLSEGAVLAVDELDAWLHPLLTKQLVGLFNSVANRFDAQLIFATHDQALLTPKSIRRDQVWFAEKDEYGASSLFCLDEIKGVRKDANFEKEYLLGQFGGVPRIGNLERAILDAEK